MEEHPTKKPGRLQMVSVFMGPDSATKMKISGEAVERWPEAGRGAAAAAERIAEGAVA